MTDTLHTVGPIRCHEHGEANQYAILSADGKWMLAALLHNGEAMTERQRANMRRLVACWNALEPLRTEHIEQHAAAIAKALLGFTREDADGLSHSDMTAMLRARGDELCQLAADTIDYLSAQEDLLEVAQKEAERARTELANAKQPLDAQMARLNQRVIDLTAELDAERRGLPMPGGAQFTSAEALEAGRKRHAKDQPKGGA